MASKKYQEIRNVSKSERLEARITLRQKLLFQRAAELKGLSLTDFLVMSTQTAAEATIREYNVITLSGRDSLAFAEALLNPSEPNEALQAVQDAVVRDDEAIADED